MTASSLLSRTGLLGYLTFVEFASHGMVGGYLLVNQYARPVEFHCTAPVCPTRTHRILYGPTLRSVLCSDQIGPSLLQQSKLRPQVLLTDEPEALALRAKAEVPTALVRDVHASFDDAPQSHAEHWSFVFGGRVVTTSPEAIDDHEAIEQTLRQLGGEWDLAEPLERIRAAIQEAHQAAA